MQYSAPADHSGPGTGGMTSKLFYDWYDFTRDEKVLMDHAPALDKRRYEYLLVQNNI